MKTNHIWLLLFLLMALFPACDDEFKRVNTNPNAATDIDDEYLFANSVLQTIRGPWSLFDQNFPFGSQYAHIYVGINQARYIDTYFDYFTNTEYLYLFEGIYHGPIRLVNETLRLTQPGGEKENEVRHAMAKTIALVNFAHLADSYGSIPYEEGGYGQKGILYPEYNSVEFIYTDMMTSLKEIIELLKTANPQEGYPGADPLFENDLDKWVKFANSLRLRLAMHARFVAPQIAEAVISECMAEPLIEENAHNAWKENQKSDITDFNNPIFDRYDYWKWKMSERFVETLKTTGDPRLKVFVKPNKDGEYVGIPNGLNDDGFSAWDWSNTSDPTDSLVGKGAPSYLMSAAEIWLLRAEAALFDLIPGDANEMYRTGIRRSLEQWNVSESDMDDFLDNADYGRLTGTQEAQFEQIATQLWISCMPNALESWTTIRRTGYPVIPRRTAPNLEPGVSKGELPKRLKYPALEININHNNYLKALEEQGPDKITTPLWWDVRD